jgi:nicotinate-nucleotide pyrophosphorylase (carboxylating)
MSEVGIFVTNALSEDLGRGDLFSKVLKADNNSKKKAIIINKNKITCILSGVKYCKKLSKLQNIKVKFLKQDGDSIKQGDIIAKLKGDSNVLVKIERVFLNLLQHSSGIATKTKILKQKLNKINTKIILLDTRKTTPNLRIFEKYSTLNGGAINHRLGLDDCLMLKDTHLKIITKQSTLKIFIKQAKSKIPWSSKIEVECPNIKKAKEAMQCGCDIIMCDNMNALDSLEVVKFRDSNPLFKHILIEASGNIDENNISEYARVSKVDAISSGSITHQATWIDLSMKVL